MYEKVVIRFNDGKLVKGWTEDTPARNDEMVITPAEDPESTLKIKLRNAKAIFFVKSFDGAPERSKPSGFPSDSCAAKSHVLVEFKDGEHLWGCASGHVLPTMAGNFYVSPADPASNNERVYVVSGGVASVIHD